VNDTFGTSDASHHPCIGEKYVNGYYLIMPRPDHIGATDEIGIVWERFSGVEV
jgi:hypothetical protein